MIISRQPRELTVDERNDVVRMFAHLSVSDIATKYAVKNLTIEQVLRDTLWGIGRLNQQLMQQLAEKETVEAQAKEATA